MTKALYNENDPYCAAWLRNLVSRGLIAPGDVAECSIEDLRPADLTGYSQVHFFAGIGVWSYALRRAGWSDASNVWTGSCPCQPFSAAGKGGGFDDERHLWPHFHYLIEQCRPAVVLGEQVASKDGLAWLDLVQSDLEGSGYAAGAVDACAAGFGAPHIRQRLYWMGHSGGNYMGSLGVAGKLADAAASGRREKCSDAGRLAVGDGAQGNAAGLGTSGRDLRPGPTNGFWSACDWLYCRDGKWRPVEPGTFPLAHGASARVGRLRAYGNAINAEQATAFCEAALEAVS